MKLTEEKSKEQASIINSINILLHALDTEYLKTWVSEFKEFINKQQTMIILNPSYPLSKIESKKVQAKAVSHLIQYVECLREVDRLKGEAQQEQEVRSEVMDAFFGDA